MRSSSTSWIPTRTRSTHDGGFALIVVGVDGCRGGWAALALDVERGAIVDGEWIAGFDEVFGRWPPATVVGVDMPIGVPANGVARACDLAARAYVGARRSSVFVVPPRDALLADTHADAVAACRRIGAAAPSRQAWGLRHRIAEVESVVASHIDVRILEVFPEAAFRFLAGHDVASKKSWEGQEERRRLLGGAGVVLDPDVIGTAGRAAPDDVLDAAAVAWSAARIARGEASHLPDNGAADEPLIWF